MESVGSNSPSPDRRSSVRFRPTQPIADRIFRALRHPLLLLHRSGPTFYILGATANVYTVTLTCIPSCTCPDRTIPCKHILFTYLRVLGVSVDDPCLRKKSLRPCQLSRFLATPTLVETLAGPRMRERFHQMYKEFGERRDQVESGFEEGSKCPVCLEEMRKEERVVACRVCRNWLHEECLKEWKRRSGRRVVSCVLCRARWRERKEERRYLNLGPYVGDENGEGGCVV